MAGMPRANYGPDSKPYPGAPPASKEWTQAYNAARKPVPNPFALANGGLKNGDLLTIDWIGEGPTFAGCRVECFRPLSVGRQRLIWQHGGPLRDKGGKCFFAPFLNTRELICEFARNLATVAGFELVEAQFGPQGVTFILSIEPFPSRRLIAGDYLEFSVGEKSFSLFRGDQGTLDRSLWKPDENALVLKFEAPYITMSHHSFAVARTMAEVNGLKVNIKGQNRFLITT